MLRLPHRVSHRFVQLKALLHCQYPVQAHHHPAGYARQLAGHRECAEDQDSPETEGVLLRGQSRTRR